MEYIIVEKDTGKILSVSSRPDDGYVPDTPEGCLIVFNSRAQLKKQYYDFAKKAVVDMPPRPDGVATFNYHTKRWDVDTIASVRSARADEYPPIGDQLDALWKLITANRDKLDLGQSEQLLDMVQAVKEKYPKPSE